MRFRVFRLYDALTFGAAAVIATVLAAWAAVTPQDPSIEMYRWVGLWGVVAFFWFGYVRVLLWRWSFRKKISFTSRHGVHVIPDRFNVQRILFEDETQRVLDGYVEALKAERGEDCRKGIEEAIHDTLVIFKEFPFELHQKPQKLAGFVKPHRKAIMVGYRDPLETTALGHEYGHLILELVDGNGKEERLRSFTAKHKLPY